MRILVVGAGGVGSAVVPIAARRDFFEAMVVADYDATRAERAVARQDGDPRFIAARVDASSAEDVAALAREHRITHVLNAVDPRFVHADLRRRARGRRGLPRHGDVALAAAPRAALRGERRQARRRAVRAGGRLGRRRSAGPRRHRRRARPVGRLRPLRRRPPVQRDRRDRHPRRREPRRRRLRLRAVVLDLDHDRGVPQPAGHLGARPRLVHDRRRSASRRCSTSPRGSGRSSASTSSTRRCCSSRAGSTRGG